MSSKKRRRQQLAARTGPLPRAGSATRAAVKTHRSGLPHFGSGAVFAGIGLAVLLGLGAIFFLASQAAKPSASSLSVLDPAQAPTFSDSKYPYRIGQPGAGQKAPALSLPAIDGSTFDLASQGGGSTLLYFQEGVLCEPCWSQVKDVEKSWVSFRSLGLARMVTVTTDPLDALKQKASDERLTFPVLSDAGFSASKAFGTFGYGMMGDNANGHTFILVGPDGRIRWRADYGAPPHMYMFIPVPDLLTDIRRGLSPSPSP